uniref:Uncharacterized protein n=1 Tax=Siphoviridae sp. ctEBu1 TaxID=2825393 RepID=A0A8S5QHW1_9CAUD|nr:MAG TPA: hypothetical protein [Siphoviridae sp. ctEBu1]
MIRLMQPQCRGLQREVYYAFRFSSLHGTHPNTTPSKPLHVPRQYD